MDAPVPKPRTKFGESAPESNGIDDKQPIPMTNSDQPTITTESLSPNKELPKPISPPAVPPRPPTKPPRAAVATSSAAPTTVQNFGNVLGELRINLGEPPQPPDIGMIVPSTSSDDSSSCISPPRRHAPPPPRPAPPAGWRPEIVEPVEKPDVPERSESHRNRPLPAIPDQKTVENPIYLSLENYRSLAGITPSPSIPNASPNCDQLREWLTEEEEEDRPNDLDLNSSIATTSSEQENPYTPCPRRSDYSASEFIATTVDPFDDEFFTSPPRHRTSTTSSKAQNLYVSHQELLDDSKDFYENVVEVCVPETSTPSPRPPVYVNIPTQPPTASIDEEDLQELGKIKIDGSSITFVGFVNLTSSKKEKRLHCRLRNMRLSFHEDEESTEPTHGPYDIKDISMFRHLHKETSSEDTVLLHIGDKKVVTFVPEDPANLWMFFISEAWLSLHYALTPALRDADELSICGSLWIKHGTTGEWVACSTGINKLTLYYMLASVRDRVRRGAVNEIVEVDVRKITTMRERVDKTEFCPNVKHKRGPFSMTLHGVTLYIDSRDESTTCNWFEVISELLRRPAGRLENYRLTADNTPVIVDKCIRFVSTYGMTSEGIYRRNGKITEAKTILTKLTEDPVGYYLVRENDETVYAVADVLRQFFRRLTEPLFPHSIQTELFDLACESASDDLWARYATLIGQLPTVYLATLKKLVGHLKIVAEHSEENRASVENLAKVFGASLFSTDSMDEKAFSETYNQQINTMIQLINGYDVIFKISVEEELSRTILNEAEKKAMHMKKPPADFIVAIHVWEKENRPFNVKMSFAAGEVCREAVARREFDGPPESPYAVFEHICNGHLVRRLAAAEKVSKCVLRWIDWNCKDGYLMFDHDKYRFDGSDMSCFTGKVKIAEPGLKTFKSYEAKIENGTSIATFRNDKPFKSWPLDAVLWYVGAEPSRRAPHNFNVTMIAVSREGYTARHPGYCFSFKEEAERTRWLTALSHFTESSDSEPLVYF